MDFLSLESAHLLQGKGPYYGYGWSNNIPSSATVGTDGECGGSIIGPSSVAGSVGTGSGGYGSSGTDRRVASARMPTPLDPLLKHLKREYASSAGPQDVLASKLSMGDLEFLSSEAAGSGPVKRPGGVVAAGAERSVAAPLNVEKTARPGQSGGLDDILEEPLWTEGTASRAATPLASGGGADGRPSNALATSASSLYSPEQQHSPSHSSTPHAQYQKQKRGLMPAFCHSPTTHVDNLLRATPHLRHLSEASTDMSGMGVYDESKNVFAQMLNFNKSKKASSSGADGGATDSSFTSGGAIDWHTSLLRQRSNRRASLELASFMRLLSNEMPQEEFAGVESEVYAKVFGLVHSKAVRADDRLAGVAALEALLSVPSADEERRAIRFGNNLSNGLKSSHGDYEFLYAVARALGQMAAGASNVDRVEFEIGRSLEWLRSDRSDRRLAAALVLRELARCAPTAFYSRTHNASVHHPAAGSSGDGIGSHLAGLGGTNDFLDNVFPALRDPQPIVRASAADALTECLNILMERQRRSMTAPLCALYADMMEGLEDGLGFGSPGGRDAASIATAAVDVHGSLLVVDDMIRHCPNFMLPRFDEVCEEVLKAARHPLVLIRLEVVRLIPKLAGLCPEVFGRRYLRESLAFLISSAAGSASQQTKSKIDVKPSAFMSIGQLALAMSDEESGGGDIMIPTVRILRNEFEGEMSLEDEENDDFDFHTVELKKESDFGERIGDIFGLISDNLKHNDSGSGTGITGIAQCDLLGCLCNFVEALGVHAAPYVMPIVEDLFDTIGLSADLIACLHSIGRSVPSKQHSLERRIFVEISACLAGKTVDLFSMKRNGRPKLADLGAVSTLSLASNGSMSSSLTNLQPTLEKNSNFLSSMSLSSMTVRPKKSSQTAGLESQHDTTTRGRADSVATVPPTVAANVQPVPSLRKSDSMVINTSTKLDVVEKLVLSFRTLRTIGESYMQVLELEDGNALLPFLRSVISEYFLHPSSDVRREAAITCCLLLLPFAEGRRTKMEKMDEAAIHQQPPTALRFRLGSVSGGLVEEILQKLLRMAVSDSSPVVRLCIVQGLDERYDAYLSLNLLAPLFLLLEDEALAVRARALQILGRLSRLNPAPILPGLRQVLMDLIICLRCRGDDGGGREVATRLIVVFLREEAVQALTRPFIPSIIDALPLANVAPRLATASLEALGELATVAHGDVNPWLRQLISYILENIQDQNSSKQRVSLWALGKIAYGTSYVVTPYLDYPQLLTQAADILPTTKRASWDLRREVFRTFGILGALDPDRFGSRSTARKGGGKGGGYFVELEDEKGHRGAAAVAGGSRSLLPGNGSSTRLPEWTIMRDQLSTSLQGKNASSVHADPLLVISSNGNHNKQAKAEGSRSRPKGMHKDSDNDEPAHLFMYEQYAMTSQPLSQLSPAKRLSPSDEAFYPTVAVQALMRILKDSSLSNLHGMVMKAVMFIFNALGLKSVPFLKPIVPHILVTVKNCGQHGLREALLQQVANLSAIVREHLRPYLPAIFDVVEDFWFTRHLSALCSLVERVAAAVPDDFREYVPLLVRQILASIEAIDITPEWSGNASAAEDIQRLELILRHVQGIKGVLGDYIHLVVPALVKLTNSLVSPDAEYNMSTISPPIGSSRSELAVETVQTLSILLQTLEVNPSILVDTSVKSNSALPARVIQPMLRMLGGDDVRPNRKVGEAIIECLCICVRQLGAGRWMSFYHETARDAIATWQTKVGLGRVTEEQGLSEMAGNEQHLPIDLYLGVVDDINTNSGARWDMWNGSSDASVSDFSLGRSGSSDVSLSRMGENLRGNDTPSIQPPTPAVSHAHRTNVINLQRAWDVSQRSTREDWDEWMRRYSVQLLREAPSPALRACAELAQAYQPLARELFSAAFVCCWGELNDQYRQNLVFSLEVVFNADASLEILQLLLNLAEFMEHDFEPKGKVPGLSIDISVLAELALKCRAYARALHYKEREYIKGRGGSCVESLIDINKKLDLPEAALGILKAAKIEIERQGGRSLASTPNQTDSRHDMTMAYSVITSYGDVAGDQGSWADISYESWLAKLGSWAEAVSLYEQKLRGNPNDVNSILGCMQCYQARGEWQQALDLAGRSWAALSGDQSLESEANSWHSRASRKKSSADIYKQALKFCAQSAWRLGKWDELETYSTALVGSHVSSQPQSSGSMSSAKESRSITNAPRLDYDGAFYRSVLHIHRAEWDEARKNIDSARKAMDSRFTALLAESYKRAYPSMVSAQELSELEEIISFRQLEMRRHSGINLHEADGSDVARRHLLDVWRQRLDGCRVDAEVHSSVLAVRSLVLGPTDEVDATITLSALSRQAEAFRLAERTLLDPLAKMKCSLNSSIFGVGLPTNLGIDLTVPGESIERIVNGEISVQMKYMPRHELFSKQLFNEAGGEPRLFIQHKLYFAYIKHLWATDRKDEAMTRLGLLCKVVDLTTECGNEKSQREMFRVGAWLRYGDWKLALTPPGSMLSDTLATEVLLSYKRATDAAVSHNYRAFHSWALINFRLAEQLHGNEKDKGGSYTAKSPSVVRSHVIAAVKGFVRAISVGTKRWSASVQQDLLNLLSCLFKHGELEDVSKTINEGLESIKIEAWLGVLPQLLARIHIKSPSVRSVLHPLLVRLGAKHPQALMYPLSVLLKSPVVDRKVAAESLMNSLKAHSNALVEEALMVSSELIRVAILWLELWHEGLEDASRLYYGEGNVSGMLDVLLPLHNQLEKGASTRREQEFLKSFGRDLGEAHQHIKEYVRLITDSGQAIPTQGGFMSPTQNGPGQSGSPANAEAEAALNQAWDLYYTVFRRINKQLPGMTTLELDQCSPALFNAKNLSLGVPGTYHVDGSYVKIQKFITDVTVITSKQRPRKIIIRGNDGKDYVFLLKGHEDLRQDERVMQLFGLVNALLMRDRRTNKHDLNIQRYAIAPLSHNAGVVGWVPHCDTLHCLIRDYRETIKIPLNAENREMMALAPNYDSLTAMQKVEIFTEALERTAGKGNDLYEVLWMKSINSEEWLERRTNFTRSLAVMSMVGYILGLGDRHPSNLMLDQISGRVLHIDFGDCFEVAMHREKFPERVPFRLTRMLTRAMEVSGIEGSYRSTCERTMAVLRDNKDSLVAMLEAFVYDPLISWRLLNQSSGEVGKEVETTESSSARGDQDLEARTPLQNDMHNPAIAHTVLPGPIKEEQNEDGEDEDGEDEDGEDEEDKENDEDVDKNAEVDGASGISSSGDSAGSQPADIASSLEALTPAEKPPATTTPFSTSHAKSLKMYSEMRALAANLSTSSRIASIAGGTMDAGFEQGSMARSRIDKSVRQRELLSILDGDADAANDEALNERALKVIRRVQDKLTGTDFHSPEEEVGEPLDVQDQVQRLIVQAPVARICANCS